MSKVEKSFLLGALTLVGIIAAVFHYINFASEYIMGIVDALLTIGTASLIVVAVSNIRRKIERLSMRIFELEDEVSALRRKKRGQTN